MNQNPSLQLMVRTREDILFKGPVESISSFNDKGRFDVLFNHAHFICLIKHSIFIRFLDGHSQELSVNEGVMRVKDNSIEVFLGVKH